MTDLDATLGLFRQRISHYGPLHARMQAVSAIYNDRAPIPIPDMDRNEKPSVPNLLAQGLDQTAGRVGSMIPAVMFASTKPGNRRADRAAAAAGRTITGWWERERLPIKMVRRARHLLGYAMSPVHVRWDTRLNQPYRQLRSPMECYPSLDLTDGETIPSDCFFAYRRSYGWLKANGYGPAVTALFNRGAILAPDTMVLLVEYVTPDTTVLLAAGFSESSLTPLGGMKAVILEQYANHGGMPVSVPTRITLDAPAGQFDTMIGMYMMQARLMALDQIAVEKGIFPDTYLESHPGEQARFIDGPYDGRTGRVNIIAGGSIRELQTQPGYMTNPTIDRLERAQRLTAGIPAEYGGESGSNIRTGRRGDAVLSAVIDFPIAEAQQILAYAMIEENRVGIRLAKHFDGSTPRTIYVGTGVARSPVTYTPNDTFATDEHTVTYPVTGTDVNTFTIGLGQRIGLGLLSKRTAASMDPYIDNPETEHDQIIAQSLEEALMSGIQAQAQSGQLPPLVISKLMRLVASDKLELAEALDKVTKDAIAEQEQQQEVQQAGPQTPDQAAAGAALQGLAGEQPVMPGTSAMPGIQQLGDMLGQLRRPVMTVEPMRHADQGAI